MARKAFPLRIDPDLYDALQHWADDELRSVNGQIEFLLRQAVVRAGRLRGAGAPRTADRPESEHPPDGGD